VRISEREDISGIEETYGEMETVRPLFQRRLLGCPEGEVGRVAAIPPAAVVTPSIVTTLRKVVGFGTVPPVNAGETQVPDWGFQISIWPVS